MKEDRTNRFDLFGLVAGVFAGRVYGRSLSQSLGLCENQSCSGSNTRFWLSCLIAIDMNRRRSRKQTISYLLRGAGYACV